MKKTVLILTLLAFNGLHAPAAVNAWNPIQDIEDNWKFTGDQHIVSLGTAIPLTSGKPFALSTYYQVSQYRALDIWYGFLAEPTDNKGITENQNVNLKDSAKAGLNFAYLVRNFKNKPSQFIQNLDIGPAVSCPLVVGPRQFEYWVDVNVRLGGASSTPTTAITTPTVMAPMGSRLSLLRLNGGV